MSNYSKTTNFATKDGLSSGDPLKVVKGTEIDTEFNNIATMSATKQDSLPLTDSTAIVFNSGDSTKKVRISAASVATGTTRVLTAQDLDGTIAILSQPATFTTLAGTTSVVTPIVDSGAASALALKTNNGTTQVLIAHVASAVNFLSLQGGSVGNGINILSSATSSDSNVGIDFGTKGTGVYNFYTRSDVASKKQFAILDTASADRNITVTGSNGGNPTISTTAGSVSFGAAICTGISFIGTSVAAGGTLDIPVVNGGVYLACASSTDKTTAAVVMITISNSVANTSAILGFGGSTIAVVGTNARFTNGVGSTALVNYGIIKLA